MEDDPNSTFNIQHSVLLQLKETTIYNYEQPLVLPQFMHL